VPTFKVLVHGRGLVVRHWWLFKRQLGFYATRFVVADTAEAAGAEAMEAIRGEPRLALAAIRAPTLVIEGIEAVQDSSVPAREQGIVFYSDATK
jgi:hypothetical protein